MAGDFSSRPGELTSAAAYANDTLIGTLVTIFAVAIAPAPSTVIGIILMCSRLLFGTSGAAADSDHIVGSLVVTFSIMAMGEVARPLRFVNIGFGAWLVPERPRRVRFCTLRRSRADHWLITSPNRRCCSLEVCKAA